MPTLEWSTDPTADWDAAADSLTPSLFLRARWIRVVAGGYGRPVICLRAAGAPPAAMAAGVILGPPLLRLWFSLVPYGGLFGPGAGDPDIWRQLLAALRARGCVQAQWVPTVAMAPPVPVRSIVSSGHRRQLPAGAEALWDELGRKRRSDVRRAERDGVVVTERSDDAAARTLHALYRGVMAAHRARQRYPEALFRAIAAGLPSADREFIITTVNGHPAAGALLLFSDDTAHLFIAAGDQRYRSSGAGDVTMATALARAAARGMTSFDFMGSPPGDSSVVSWKEKWAGVEYEQVRHVVRLAPLRGALVDLALAWTGGRPRRRQPPVAGGD